MKKVMKLAYLLMGVALLLSSCSEDIFPGGSESNEDVTISLAYSDVSPRDIVVNSRATPEEERHLNNLYIYIFDGNGNLKGYKGIEGEENLNQETSSTTQAQIKGIKTRSGESYIYAVANIHTGLYPVETSSGTVAANKLPINLDEEKARAGGYDFTLDQLKALTFKRSDTSIDITSAFLMSGAVKEGKLVNITTAGTIAGDDNAIRLSRIVSKVKFTIKAADNTTRVTRSFKLETYDIMNIAIDGSLVGKIDGNSRKKTKKVSYDIGNTVRPNDVEAGAQIFEVYLPENLQDAVHDVPTQAEREDDSQSIPKKFTNAPANGTYVVLKGKYEETTSSSTKSADVTYYVHLGDCTRDKNNYDVERNCKYTYNITVAGVDKIIVEATKEEGKELQPGAEGVVLEYGATGKNMTLDSHYEYMVMRFYQKDIQALKNKGKGYFYQVYALGNHTDVINVGETTVGKYNGVDTSWIQFAIKCSRDGSSSTYSTNRTSRGTACSYPGTDYSSDLYTVEKFLKYLYDNANSTRIWTKSDSKGKYIDATCFISENYYKNLKWNQYVNEVDKRAFYVANEVEASNDGRSVYAKTQYGLTQYNIQTFYDRSKAGSITAYGCETINDEEGKGFTVNGDGEKYNSAGTNTWNGRTNMLADINTSTDTWKTLKDNKSLIKACMSRNRDLNGDGKISYDEIRWYAPTTSQYIGIWIGEEIISGESKLFNKETSTLKGESDRMLYYSSTNGHNTYFSEEGLATYNYTKNSKAYPPKLVRCLRNLKSNDVGYNQTPAKYYTYDNDKSVVTLDNVDEKALLTSGGAGELNAHTERSELNKPAKQFQIASKTYKDTNHSYYNNGNLVWTTQKQIVEDGTVKCYGNYSEGGDKNWRVPNQRELSLMFLVDKGKIENTYCRTKFSYPDFRKSWTYSGGVFTMDVSKWNATGSIRCIKVLK